MKIMMVLPRHGESVAPFMTLFSFYDILCLVLALEFCLVVCLARKLILRIEASAWQRNAGVHGAFWIKTSLRFVIQLQVFYVPKSLRGRLPSYLTCISAWDFRFCHRTEVETGKPRPS